MEKITKKIKTKVVINKQKVSHNREIKKMLKTNNRNKYKAKQSNKKAIHHPRKAMKNKKPHLYVKILVMEQKNKIKSHNHHFIIPVV
jgi:hypothetical protein